MLYEIIKKGTEKPRYYIRITGNNMVFGYVGGYRGFDYRDSYEECKKDLDRLMEEDRREREENERLNKEETVFSIGV